MTTYGQFCPVAQALEIIAERWTLLVVRELLCGSHRFNDLLRGVPKMSRTMLSARLKSLEDAGLVHRRLQDVGGAPEYHLTRAGEELKTVVMSVGEWGHRWLDGTLPETQLDPGLLMWDIHRRIDHEAVTLPRVIVRFEFSDLDQAKKRYWLKLEDGDAEVCFKHPGFAEDLVVVTDVRTLTEVWMGRRALADAIASGVVRIDGTPSVRRDFPAWLKLSTFALNAKA
jgi:DNA-binding HxlR family transcriptional regulator